jgi:hypothetical protein
VVGAGFGIGRIVGMLLVNGKASGLAALTVGAVATTTAVGVAELTPIDPLDTVGEVGTSIRNATIGGSGDEEASELIVDDRIIQLPAAPVQAPVQAPAAAGQLPSSQPSGHLPAASQLDPVAALSGLPGLLETAGNGGLSSVEPLLAFVDETLAGVLGDPLGTLTQLLTNPGATVDELTGNATEAVNQTTQNTTTTVDDTVDQTTDIVDGLVGENELTGSLDETVDNTTDLVDGTVGGVTGLVDETTDDLGETLDDLLGDDGLLNGDDGLLGGLGGGSSDDDDEEDDGGGGGLLEDLLGGGDEENEPPCIPILFLVTCD